MHTRPRLLLRPTAAMLAACAVLQAPLLAQVGSAPTEHATLDSAEVPARARDDARVRARAMIDKAIAYLKSQQDQASGGWRVSPAGQGPTFPAITALVVQGMLTNAQGSPSPEDPALQEALRFLLDSQQQDGGIYREMLPSYNTAIALSALSQYPRSPRLSVAIAKAQDFLKGLQYGEGALEREDVADAATKVTPDHAYYGGVGYGNRGRPDLSNLAFAIEGLRDSGLPDEDPFFARAIAFLERCQMLDREPSTDPAKPGRQVNDMAYASGSTQGGFIYATSINKQNIGSGQSFAGEIAESLSGPAGSVARITLSRPRKQSGEVDVRGEQAPLDRSRDQFASIVRACLDDAGLKEAEFMVLLGQTGDGVSSASFEVRASCDARALEKALHAGLTGKHQPTGLNVDVVYDDVPAWRGESRLRAYGSMTYAGFKSYLYAGLSRDDARVAAARDWISLNYTVRENPGLGTDGLYYYFVTFAKALDAWGEPVVQVAGNGQVGEGAPRARAWSIDLIERLSELQNDDGSFRSVDDRWMENDPVLITAYSLIALRHATRGLDAMPEQTGEPDRPDAPGR